MRDAGRVGGHGARCSRVLAGPPQIHMNNVIARQVDRGFISSFRLMLDVGDQNAGD